MYETIKTSIAESENKHASLITIQLLKIFDQFLSDDRKKLNIDPKPLFNCLIQKYNIFINRL